MSVDRKDLPTEFTCAECNEPVALRVDTYPSNPTPITRRRYVCTANESHQIGYLATRPRAGN